MSNKSMKHIEINKILKNYKTNAEDTSQIHKHKKKTSYFYR
jgi:hypothetical protein